MNQFSDMFKNFYTFCLVVSTLIAFPAKSDDSALVRLADELSYVSSLVQHASAYQRIDTPEIFKYDYVLRNIRLIKEAIERHVSRPAIYPRHIEELYDLTYLASLASSGPTEVEEQRLRIALDELSVIRDFISGQARYPSSDKFIFNYVALDDSLLHIERALSRYADNREYFNPRSLAELEVIYGRPDL